ncbi:unnamed protein product [Candida verbasci]|uniref:mRNA transport regulator MTR2 n=1 Tax=Candida verbasci TaxID=1227364 RepID=A0A9W4TYW6_9ASCO|nr:unnamed protein product [Candida verbasci]
MNQDPTQPIESFLKNFLNSLDSQYQPTSNVANYALQFGSSLKRTSALILNGKPIIPTPQEDSKLTFQKKWLSTPLTSHQLTSYDAHLIPGTGQFIINFSAKVKFDQSGKNRLGESADLIKEPTTVTNANSKPRPIWGSWNGIIGNLVVDETLQNECINSLDYRLTYIPQDSILKF